MDTMRALADPTRRRIVESLARGPLSSGEIASRFDITAPAISQHLKTLRNAEAGARARRGATADLRTDLAGIDEMSDWLTRIRHFWSARLDALGAQLIKEQEG